MKKSVLVTLILTVFAFAANATIFTVSNNPDSPGQYTNLQTAIDASQTNDTIMVAGSNTTYGNVYVYWKLTLIGAGYNNPYGLNTTIGKLYLKRTNAQIGASGSKVMGFYLTSNLYIDAGFSGGTLEEQVSENVVIERCRLYTIQLTGGNNTFRNDTIRNCIITSYVNTANSTSVFDNVYFHNNIFSGSYLNGNSTTDCSKVYLKNNILLSYASTFFYNIMGMVVENNIFYKAYPQGGINCAFNNNITFMNTDNTIPGANNVGSGNQVDVDPQFVDFPLLGATFDYSYDFHLQASSPGVNAGTDGTDIGIYGGMAPFEISAPPAIPQMVEVSMPTGSSVPAGGTLNVHFIGVKQD